MQGNIWSLCRCISFKEKCVKKVYFFYIYLLIPKWNWTELAKKKKMKNIQFFTGETSYVKDIYFDFG